MRDCQTPLLLRSAARRLLLACLASLLVCLATSAGNNAGSARAEDPSAEGTALFNRSVLPVLQQKCYDCHSHAAGKSKGGLMLDSRGGWTQGGESGPAIIPGKPDESLLLEAIRHGSLEMPPDEKLPAETVALIAQWISLGAPDPRTADPSQGAMHQRIAKAQESHWSFQPITNPTPPPVEGARHPIDRFVRSQLPQHGLAPNPPADARTLVRRAYFDLIGLPPPYEVVERFAVDPSEAAWESLLDDLLSRPEYGQRWARHWLDVARYADTVEASTDAERRIPFAHTYRDYVVDALNQDKSYQRFVLEQIAADRLPDASPADLRALGFFAVGRQFAANAEGPALRVDDRIDVVGRGFLGLTLACARCHDHKFDPTPTRDYYSLYGILDSFEQPLDLPEVTRTGDPAAISAYEKKRAEAIAAYEAHVDACLKSSNQHLRDYATEYLQYLVRASENHRTTTGDIPLDTPRGWLVYHAPDRWAALLEQCRQRDEPFFRLWRQLMALPQKGFARQAKGLIDQGLKGHHPAVQAAFIAQPPADMLAAATTYGQIIAAELQQTDSPVVELIFGSESPLPPRDRDEIREDLHRFLTSKQLVGRADGEKAKKLQTAVHLLEVSAPVDRALTVQVRKRLPQQHVFLRGDLTHPGETVPRRFLHVLAAVDDREYPDDGRLQLAQAIASDQNPLTARVAVNRVWSHHFGAGLTTTLDDFGYSGLPPSHPALLDHLAFWFMEHGWSLKALHRYVMTSETWRQASTASADALERDPENRYLWRMPPRQLEFEPLRDSLLQAAGRLDTRMGGRGALLNAAHHRRALYSYTDRFRIPALLRNFDVANPDTSIAQRSSAIVPLQALYLMNSPFVRQQAEHAVARPEVARVTEPPARIQALFRLVLSRNPTAAEAALALKYVQSADPEPAAAGRRWASLAQGLMLSNEFLFVD
ncbi:PSD1 and planctomycete cytochrome C domain-containing protein [Lignipirellula cremea]|uniref:Planctomycete cytochrome C n=1 Tax=Lignipirellula cremea TaxID=2528010 RepID=A0A518DMP5_9BACT|nr:PSD1 and planctomycete cytochrome C domain-containing protein [Lignipirellula cremea]QDU93105.1 Planctomycete cytochrome C [Lignipirellula cremea]